MKAKRSIIIPLVLLVYLAVMATIGWDEYAAGRSSALYYFGTIAVTLIIIVLLHFNLRRRERLRRERLDDIARNERNNQQNKE